MRSLLEPRAYTPSCARGKQGMEEKRRGKKWKEKKKVRAWNEATIQQRAPAPYSCTIRVISLCAPRILCRVSEMQRNFVRLEAISARGGAACLFDPFHPPRLNISPIRLRNVSLVILPASKRPGKLEPPKWTLLARISRRRTTQKPEERAHSSVRRNSGEEGLAGKRRTPLWLHYRDKAANRGGGERVEKCTEAWIKFSFPEIWKL